MSASYEPAGHYVGVQVQKLNGKYRFVVANAGDGARENHRLVGGRVITTNVYEVESRAEAEEILKNIALVRNTPIAKHLGGQEEKFYRIFKNAQRVEDFGVPARFFQYTPSCTMRNQFELFYRLAQDLGMTKLANTLQDTVLQISQENSYAALQELLPKPGERPPIVSLTPGNRVEIRDLANRSVSCLPKTPGKEYAIFSDGKVSDNTSETKTKIVVDERGKFTLQTAESITIIRGNSRIAADSNRAVEVHPGDRIAYGKLNLVIGETSSPSMPALIEELTRLNRPPKDARDLLEMAKRLSDLTQYIRNDADALLLEARLLSLQLTAGRLIDEKVIAGYLDNVVQHCNAILRTAPPS
jgi:hypothetical protein